jgi:hypothetical protein
MKSDAVTESILMTFFAHQNDRILSLIAETGLERLRRILTVKITVIRIQRNTGTSTTAVISH